MLTSEMNPAEPIDGFSKQQLSPAASEPLPSSRKAARTTVHDWSASLGVLALDFVSWGAIYALATFIRGDAFYASALQFALVELLQLGILVAALFVIGGYNPRSEMRGLSYSTEHVLAVAGAAVLSAFFVYSAATFDQTMKPSRGVLLISFVAFLPFSLVYRRAIRSIVAAATATRAFLVVGSGELAEEFYRAYKRSVNHERLEFVDVEETRIGEHIAGPGSPIIEGDLATKLDRLGTGYSGVILAERIDRLRPELLERLVRTQFHDTRVYTLESFHEAHWRYVPIHSLDPFWPLQMGFQLARNSPYHYLKRLFDLALAGLLLVICAPLIALISLIVRMENGAPAIFRQTRVGRDDVPFTIFKFRTMVERRDAAQVNVTGSELIEESSAPILPNNGERGTNKSSVAEDRESRKSKVESRSDTAEPEAVQLDVSGSEGTDASSAVFPSNNNAALTSNTILEPSLPDNHDRITTNPVLEEDDIYTRRNDPRITRAGRWLRKARLDELPQLWNVFRGEMSMIGPRAEWIRCAERYEKVIPFYHFRHLVKPGITGWAQVNYGYGESDEDAIEKLKYDLYYIRNYSLKLDLMIVLKTVYTVVFGKGQ